VGILAVSPTTTSVFSLRFNVLVSATAASYPFLLDITFKRLIVPPTAWTMTAVCVLAYSMLDGSFTTLATTAASLIGECIAFRAAAFRLLRLIWVLPVAATAGLLAVL